VTFVRVAGFSELFDGERRCFTLEERRVFLIKLEGRVYAYENRCAHRELPIGTGRLEGYVLTCPAHEWQYDIRSGRGVNPDGARLRVFEVKIENDDVFVDVGLGVGQS
jgi:nitrite reductase/ring-hydroxylating ferredoxin subunit